MGGSRMRCPMMREISYEPTAPLDPSPVPCFPYLCESTIGHEGTALVVIRTRARHRRRATFQENGRFG